MNVRKRVIVALVVIATAGCVCVSPDQAVNISELHDGIGRLMPYAQREIQREIAEQNLIANDKTRSQADRDTATNAVVGLTGRLMEVKLLPGLSEPIRDWAIAKVDTATFLKAKAARDAQVGTGGSN